MREKIKGYILCRHHAGCVRYVPLYIHSFPLSAPGKLRRPGWYEDIDNIPDRLRWRRHSRGLTQKVTKGDQQKVLGGVFQGKGIGKAGNRRTIRLFPASFPPSVVGAYTIRCAGAIWRIRVSSRMPECHGCKNAGTAFYSQPGAAMAAY